MVGLRLSPGVRHSAVVACLAVFAVHAPSAHAVDPGWYFGIEGFYSSLKDAEGPFQSVEVSPAGDPDCVLLPPAIPIPFIPCLVPGTPGTDVTTTRTGTNEITFKDGFGGGFSFGYMFEGGLRPEFSLHYSENDIETLTRNETGQPSLTTRPNDSLNAFSLLANAWYDFDLGTVIPYLGGGIGFQRTTYQSDASKLKSTDFSYQAGAGLGFWLAPRTILSLDYRYTVADKPRFESDRENFVQTEYEAHRAGLSLKYLFSEGAVHDSDGDGVPDRKDKCPNTPKGVQVYSDGCPLDLDGDGVPDYLDKCPGTPAGTQVNEAGCALTDVDNDGVPDQQDRCPGTPPGVPVGADGCPLDSDGDGIPDYLDECPNSPAGAKVLPNGCALKGDCRKPRPGEEVDENGCAVEQRFVLRGVKFEFDSDRLLPESKEILNDVAETLKSYDDIGVEVEGHTDDIGTDAYNLGLAERRSNAVKTYLVGRGIPASRMTPVGYGETRPLASNDTEDGREENRRVEFRVSED